MDTHLPAENVAINTPLFLYKYKSFGSFLLDELCGSETYFASPSLFNDPLDSKPSVEDDLPPADKAQLLAALLREHEPKTDVQKELARFRYLANEDATAQAAVACYEKLITSKIEQLLQQEIGKRGVLCLAERWDCPLMWSHYARNHEGLCLEYSTHDHVARNLLKVQYDVDRAIKLSELFDWKVRHVREARQRVLERAYVSKAKAWSYEKEWRILGGRPGANSAPLELTGIYFGERCSDAIQTVVIKALCDVRPRMAFYRVRFDLRNFDLYRTTVDTDEVVHCGIRSSAALVFGRAGPATLPPGAIPIPPSEPDEGPPYFQ